MHAFGLANRSEDRCCRLAPDSRCITKVGLLTSAPEPPPSSDVRQPASSPYQPAHMSGVLSAYSAKFPSKKAALLPARGRRPTGHSETK